MVDLHELAKYTDVKMLAVGSEPTIQCSEWVKQAESLPITSFHNN